jgi:phosphoglycolate phosphatase
LGPPDENLPDMSPQSRKIDVDLLVFDLDGTLADSLADLTDAANFACRQLGLPEHLPQAVQGMIGGGERKFLERVVGPTHQDLVAEGLKLYLDYYTRHCGDKTRLYPGVRETLAHFVGKSLAVISNKRLSLTEQVLKVLDIRPFFQAVKGGGEEVELKPSPQQLLQVLSELGVPPWRAVMVGDKPADVLAGRAAATFTAALTCGYGEAAALQEAGPDFLIGHLIELTALVV